MQGTCENCGMLGDMKPGRPFSCEACGHWHDAAAVDARIAAFSAGSFEPDPMPPLPPSPLPPPPRLSAPMPSSGRFPSPRPPHRTKSRRVFFRHGELWAAIAILLVVVAVAWGVKACLMSKVDEVDSSPSRSIPSAKPKADVKPYPQPKPSKAVRHEGGEDRVNDAQPARVWRPGMKHPKQPHIYALEKPGSWAVEPGYELVHPGTDDWSVRKIPMYANCRKCSGAGFTERNVTCPTCRGRRTVRSSVPHVEFRNRRRRLVYPNVPCPTCRGAGRVKERRTCPACTGQRVVPTKGVR